jgi:integrase
MAPHPQNKYLQKLRADVAKGLLSKEDGAERIAKLEKKPKKFIARWTLPDGNEGTKTFPTKREAKLYEEEMRVFVRMGAASAPKHLRVKMETVFDFYLQNKMAGKASYPNARAHCRHAVQVLGASLTLERFDAHADSILLKKRYEKDLREAFPEAFQSQSSMFNHRTYVHSAVAYWIKMKRLRMVNPYQIWSVDKPDNARKRAPTFDEFKRLLAAVRDKKYPVWMTAHLVMAWEHGRRLSEHASLRWENCHLSPGAQDLPWVKIRSLKQGGRREVWSEIPLFADTREALVMLQGIQTEGPVFAASPYVLAYWNRMAIEEAGLAGLRFHDFRRSYRNRNDDMADYLRMGMQGRKTKETDDAYLTEKRRTLEPAVRKSYSGQKRDKTTGV